MQRKSIVIHSLFFSAVALIGTLQIGQAMRQHTDWQFKPTPFTQRDNQATDASAPFIRSQFVSAQMPTASVHAATVAPTDNGELMALWFGGSREGARDVALYGARFNPKNNSWNPVQQQVTRTQTQAEVYRYIKKLGNPVLYNDGNGRLWLFYVSVSVGGWAGSAINTSYSQNNGHTWSPAKRLISSPFMNVSTLVKTAPLNYGNGDLALPAYHEMAGKFAELLRIDNKASVTDKRRISHGRGSLQPSIVALDGQQAIALMRDAGPQPGHLLIAETQDGGQNWHNLQYTDIPNPNAAAMAIAHDEQHLLLVLNDTQDNDRRRLSLALMDSSSRQWRVIHRLEDDTADQNTNSDSEYSYPFITRDQTGDYHILYTWRRQNIKHVRFNRAFVDQHLP